MVRCGFGRVGLIGSIVCLTFIFDISNVSRVGITNVVSHNLGAAIGQSNAVLTIGGITITALILAKGSTRVVISNSITVSVDSRGVISWLMVSRSRVSRLVSRSRVNNRLVDNRGGFVGRSRVDNRGRLMVNRGRVVDGSWVVDRSMMYWGMDGNMSRG